ncbi:hypothetical protein EV182_004551 [Spiromyces aspiralis]|uniref:Uncharacterized protein n=1 Tax=Spiromyces aspiralis TaxID=68401 RepID=A0ACC1HBT0_9FUNG|nr:hypothetical protein EV182_004551 [Spiromyces aspiralis]
MGDILGVVGSILGLNIAILRNFRPAGKRALSMGSAWALYGLIFFTARQSLLLEQKAKNVEYNLKYSQTRDADELFSSTVAGIITGGFIGGITRGRRGMLSGMLLFGSASLMFQHLYTRLYRQRQQIILKSQDDANRLPSSEDGSRIVDSQTAKQSGTGEEPEPTSWGGKLRRLLTTDPLSHLPNWFPIRKIPKDEYHQMLESKLVNIDQRLESIQHTLDYIDNQELKLQEQLKQSLERR